MAKTELPWLFLGRKVRPYAFAVSIAAASLCIGILTGTSVWGSRDVWSISVAALAAVSTILLWLGFWKPSTALMQHGLIISSVVFAIRGVYIGTTSGNYWTGLLSFAWCIASGGAWLLERTTGDRVIVRGGEGE